MVTLLPKFTELLSLSLDDIDEDDVSEEEREDDINEDDFDEIDSDDDVVVDEEIAAADDELITTAELRDDALEEIAADEPVPPPWLPYTCSSHSE